jgi:ABC-type dipeptide/oligopeptide/nickel transport system permease subunit
VPPPPFTQSESAPQLAGTSGTGRRRRSEPLVSGVVLTIIVAIVIILLLAIVGIFAGQALGR